MSSPARTVRPPRVAAAGALLLATLCGACSSGSVPPVPVSPEEHDREVGEWREWRHEQLTSPDGWLSLIGLYWLEPGTRTMGSDPHADLVIGRADAPGRLGSFDVAADRVAFTPAAGVQVTAGGEPFSGGVVWSSDPGEGDAADQDAVQLSHGTLTWYVIERDGRLGVRLKDSESPLLQRFTGTDSYPIAHEWRLPGRFVAHDPPKTIVIPSILGTLSEVDAPATVFFDVDGTEYSLDLWKDSDDPANFFTAFGDETNGDTTYGGGRFLWIDAPDEHGRTVVDFNRSYNPPCAFTPFSTCPLPPTQNRLPLRIEAGELAFHDADGSQR